MNANVSRAYAAAIRAAKSVNTAADKLTATTASFITAAGGHDAALKILNEKREKGRTWKQEREEGTPLYRVYNAVSVAKSRAKGPGQQQGRAGRAGQQQAGKGQQDQQQGQQQQAAVTPAKPADVIGIVLTWGPERIAQAIREQSAMLEQSAIDVLTDTLGLLLNTPKAPAPRKTAPRKAPAKRK